MKSIKTSSMKEKVDEKILREQVSSIIEDIRNNKDVALKKYNEKFDRNTRDEFRITKEEIKEAYKHVDDEFINNLKIAAKNIREFAKVQKLSFENPFEKEIYPGVILGQTNIPIESCLAYVPGGQYPLFSTALMLIIPAKVAGVKRIVACSPTMKNTEKINPKTLVAMDIAGADEIYATGGVQAIAAFTYGTEKINPVDIIVGPGNKFVTEAKRQCYGQVGIDFVAGPSEVLIIADETSNPVYIAADLLAQCEHDLNARGILLTNSLEVAQKVEKNIESMLKDLPTKDIAYSSWENNGEIILVDDMEEAIKISNFYAPEHLEVAVNEYNDICDRLTNYGSLFIGNLSAEVFGDYVSGTNHTLPTLKASRYTGGVWVGTFIKTCTKQIFNEKAIQSLAPVAEKLAKEEGLYAHAKAAEVRFKK
ncbi:TPA: histidinol dehydrogenase [Clostridioides difficile]|uniref:histidinol dehydrogenase n=1 Tax=Clostridioides difficile TaxID=1496 RepID=UPI00038CE392|nr:histidinol dehydrogenase [Clostridioides difficile]AYD21257.1 histidinol dehydrogenase [Clostridioides difficile]EGT3943332.1 histidinol dehydrogenase [Clostridioides difficile]EGT4099987.1 histidinol dehydrogenase [Clostridioides difficile]EKS6785050.1 histidinol dehydrogenase [Clostridioides difficile]EQH24556.1 histidinol dehydrogenase [Clostridioides difficile DA00211]